MNPSWQKIAAGDQTVLITGRTGTGKTHLARQIHELSHRKTHRFVAINLATLSENLIESELFGHERGAFSGADAKRIGKLEWANGGTVFLDEIGELSPRLQTKLLEALNSYTVSPVGSNREVQLNIRVVAATNRDLRAMIRDGGFREDLYFRINTFEIHLPNLSSDPTRIFDLARKFALAASSRQQRACPSFSPNFLKSLEAYPWPGNIRELRNCIEFALALCSESTLEPESLPAYIRENTISHRAPQALALFPADYRAAKSLFERAYLEEILTRYEGRINQTARETGLSKVTLIEKVRRYEIDVKRIKYTAHLAKSSPAS
jgi:DNA-binding NtrC family response regulator